MAKKDERVTTSEFASLTGIPVSKVSKLIREGKIRAKKDLGKWMILKSQLNVKAVKELSSPSGKKTTVKRKQNAAGKGQKSASPASQKAVAKKKPAPKKVKTTSKRKAAAVVADKKTIQTKKPSTTSGKYYSISEFCDMTYLTEFGITDWLKKGFLIGERESDGQWRVNADSLELSRMRRLIR